MKAINTSLYGAKITAFVLAVCMAISFVPTVLAESDSTGETALSNGQGFENVEQDGGTLFVGTARIPKSDSDSFVAVKYIYSDNILLNEKSLEFIKSEIEYFGISLPENLIYGRNASESDISETGENVAIFACGSETAPTELDVYEPYKSVEESFGNLFKGYIFSISSYASLKNILEGREDIVLSEDGKTAQTSIVMGESYVKKKIGGKYVTILMINSELKYSFSAPKITFVKDENYIAPDSNNVSSSDTATSNTASSETVSTTETTTSSTATETSVKITAGASPEFTTASTTDASSTSQTSATSAESTATSSSTTKTTTSSTTTETSVKITAGASPEFTTASTTDASSTSQSSTTSAKSTSTSSSTAETTASMFVRPTESALLSQRAIVNTRRLPLNIRSGPGMEFMVVTVLPKGTYVTVLDTENPDWYMVKTMTRVVGYAYSKYIRIM